MGERSRRPLRFLVVGVVAALVAGSGWWGWPNIGWSQDQPEQAKKPGSDLLTNPPFDKITLVDGVELFIEPVSPRPLPEIDPEEQKKKKQQQAPDRTKGGVIIGKLPTPIAAKKTDEEEQMVIHQVWPEPRDFLVKRESIKEIEYFEEFLLAEAERSARRGEFEKAFEHLLAVQSRDPNWEGLNERLEDLLLQEGRATLKGRDPERGLRLLTQLRERRPDDEELGELLVEAYADRVRRTFDAGAHAQSRRALRQMEQIAPEHNQTRSARNRLINAAEKKAGQAQGQSGRQRVETLAEALWIWPELDEVVEQYRDAFAETPILDVAVLDTPRDLGPWVRSPADARTTRLLYRPVLVDISEDATRGNPPGQLADEALVEDLGRRVVVRLKEDIQWHDGTRPVTAVDVVRTLADRALPGTAGFHARWSNLLRRIEAVSEFDIEIALNRAPLEPLAWLLAPVGPAHAGRDGKVWTTEGSQTLGTGPYTLDSNANGWVRFRKSPLAEPDDPPRIAWLNERRFTDPSAAVSALLRGDVSLLERVPPHRVEDLSQTSGVQLGRYKRPSIHRIAFDGRNPLLRNRSLRRGLSYAIDRKTILEETVLRRSLDGDNLLADGPFPQDSYANAPDVEPLTHDPLLARMLVAAARKELASGPIRLDFEYPSVPAAQLAVPKIAEAFQIAGVEVNLIERPWSELEQELRAGRKFDLVYRCEPCVEPVLDAGPLLCPGYDADPSADALAALVSPRILELLLQLEQAQDWPTARGLVLQIDRETRDELPILPLWQLEEHYAWRDRLEGPGAEADSLYDGIESWTIEPWFEKTPQ